MRVVMTAAVLHTHVDVVLCWLQTESWQTEKTEMIRKHWPEPGLGIVPLQGRRACMLIVGLFLFLPASISMVICFRTFVVCFAYVCVVFLFKRKWNGFFLPLQMAEGQAELKLDFGRQKSTVVERFKMLRADLARLRTDLKDL